MGEIIGLYTNIKDDETLLVRDEFFAKFEFKEKKFLRSKELPLFEDIKEEIQDLYVIPYLTNKNFYFLFLITVKKVGPMTRWWTVPLEYIDNATIKTMKKGDKKVAAINIRMKLPKKGLIFKSIKVDFVFYTPNIIGWQTYLSKVVEFNMKLQELSKRIEGNKKKLEDLDKQLMKGKIESNAYKELVAKYKKEIEELETKLKELKAMGVK